MNKLHPLYTPKISSEVIKLLQKYAQIYSWSKILTEYKGLKFLFLKRKKKEEQHKYFQEKS